jgi:hypothetical protein
MQRGLSLSDCLFSWLTAVGGPSSNYRDAGILSFVPAEAAVSEFHGSWQLKIRSDPREPPKLCASSLPLLCSGDNPKNDGNLI